MLTTSIKILLSVCLFCGLLWPGWVGAQQNNLTAPDSNSQAFERLQELVGDPEYPTFDVDYTDEDTLTEYTGLIVEVILGLLGVIFTLLILWAGYNWMTAGGNEEKVTKAGATIKLALIGLLIIIGAFAIWRFVFERIVAP